MSTSETPGMTERSHLAVGLCYGLRQDQGTLLYSLHQTNLPSLYSGTAVGVMILTVVP